jgi:putative tryptophan/tyrosine transport system substrate-binding protein
VRRRDFITLLGGAAVAWPLAALAQQPAMPVIGLLSSLAPGDQIHIMAAFNRGLNEAGYFEGRNVSFEYRWAAGQFDRLPALAADLIRHQVTLIAAISGTPSAMAAKSATSTVPIVFAMGSDPVTSGLVTSLNRPERNVTGATFFTAALAAKRLGILGELAPKATTIAVLANPKNPPSDLERTDVQAAALAAGLQADVHNASTDDDIDVAFTAIAQPRIGALYVGSDPLFFSQRNKIVALAARRTIPTIYADREYAEAGGLITYGTSRTAAYRQAGIYAGRILKGANPADLPVILPTKFELVINLSTAKTLGLTIPSSMQLLADEVIE